MKDICERKPWGLDRLLLRHSNETGIVAYGWFKRHLWWPHVDDWSQIAVRIDSEHRRWLDESHRGPVWLEVAPGRHLIEFGMTLVERRPLRIETVTLDEGGVVLIHFRPPLWLPFGRPTREPQWCVKRLR